MFSMKYITTRDEEFWFSLDRHGARERFVQKVRDEQGYLILEKKEPVGILQYQLLWDRVPFLSLIHIREGRQRRGYGGKALAYWEAEMKKAGFPMVLTSTQTDETAQHFYRRLGYKDCGCLVLNDCPMAQPAELFFYKVLK